MIITVLNIGNTNLAWAVFDEDKIIESGYGDGWRNIPCDTTVIGANVIINLDMAAIQNPVVLMEHKHMLYDRYKVPSNIGFDRVANMYGASRLLGSKDLAVIDCGSATTVTAVKDNVFAGGAITLGLGRSRQAVSEYFPALSQYVARPYKDDKEIFSLYSFSEDAVNMGLISMQAGYIRGYIESLKSKGINDIIITGGDGELICMHLADRDIRYEKLLTLQGYKQEYDIMRTIA